MENTKKIVSYILILTSLLFCKNNEQKCAVKENPYRVSNEISTTEQPISIGNSLYLNGDEICLKVKNVRLMHPSQINSQRHDSLYLEEVFSKSEKRNVKLLKVVDTATFKKVNTSGNYYIDSRMIYIYNQLPRPVPFFAFQRGDEKFLGEYKDWLILNNTLYFQGNKVDGVNVKEVSIRKLKKSDSNEYLELLTDGKSVYLYEYPLDKERIGFINELPDNVKSAIIQEFQLK